MSRMSTNQIREALPGMRKLKEEQLDAHSYLGTLYGAHETGCTCDFWWYGNDAEESRPLIIVLHGGGFALGDARTYDIMCDCVKNAFEVNVVCADYRLAPEHPFPAALHDICGIYAYLISHASGLGIDVHNICFLGFSSGANLALAATLAMQENEDLPRPAGLILHYPFLDAHVEPEQHNRPEGVPYEFMVAFNEFYTNGADAKNPLVSPLYASDEQLSKLPRIYAYPVAGDPLAPSCEELCNRMRALGLPVHECTIDGQYHAYIEDAIDLPGYIAGNPPGVIRMRDRSIYEAGWKNLLSSVCDCLGIREKDFQIPEAGLPELEAIFSSVDSLHEEPPNR